MEAIKESNIKIKIELSEKEANSLVSLLDVALRANGLKAADAVYFTQKIQAAAQEQEVQETPKEIKKD